MTTDIQPFAFEGDDVRVVASDMTRRLDPDERGTRPVRTPSGEQDMTVISEAGLYEASAVAMSLGLRDAATHDAYPAGPQGLGCRVQVVGFPLSVGEKSTQWLAGQWRIGGAA